MVAHHHRSLVPSWILCYLFCNVYYGTYKDTTQCDSATLNENNHQSFLIDHLIDHQSLLGLYTRALCTIKHSPSPSTSNTMNSIPLCCMCFSRACSPTHHRPSLSTGFCSTKPPTQPCMWSLITAAYVQGLSTPRWIHIHICTSHVLGSTPHP